MKLKTYIGSYCFPHRSKLTPATSIAWMAICRLGESEKAHIKQVVSSRPESDHNTQTVGAERKRNVGQVSRQPGTYWKNQPFEEAVALEAGEEEGLHEGVVLWVLRFLCALGLQIGHSAAPGHRNASCGVCRCVRWHLVRSTHQGGGGRQIVEAVEQLGSGMVKARVREGGSWSVGVREGVQGSLAMSGWRGRRELGPTCRPWYLWGSRDRRTGRQTDENKSHTKKMSTLCYF